ncbi:tetratricopeptide repeat protein [Bacillus pseudomycoides]|uniref:tetratricopeptide repeat protein n=1 Tax=Bacillus pseudomycoides TaxID=64104 RepID=UPI000BF998BE|nr:tetratricopeptide repeat protein [Bacillus pseudomycoides]PGA76452.1 hypothetical protein COL87_01125 [Bacillus pseudomycoides]PGC41201.1 hypothetical protein COM18_11755 [Bacillus pseudomycoides]PHE92375.1 hypothetical protein COF78_17430 [Bacillus pseudomycoides]
MNLISKLNEKKVDELIEAWKETKELNELMKSYIRVSMDKTRLEELQTINELEKIKETQKDIQKQLIEIGVHILPSQYYTLAKAYRNKGIALDSLEKFDLAIECYDKALEIDPNDYKSLLNRGVALDQLGDFEEAIKHYDQIISVLAPLIEDVDEEIPMFDKKYLINADK